MKTSYSAKCTLLKEKAHIFVLSISLRQYTTYHGQHCHIPPTTSMANITIHSHLQAVSSKQKLSL